MYIKAVHYSLLVWTGFLAGFFNIKRAAFMTALSFNRPKANLRARSVRSPGPLDPATRRDSRIHNPISS